MKAGSELCGRFCLTTQVVSLSLTTFGIVPTCSFEHKRERKWANCLGTHWQHCCAEPAFSSRTLTQMGHIGVPASFQNTIE